MVWKKKKKKEPEEDEEDEEEEEDEETEEAKEESEPINKVVKKKKQNLPIWSVQQYRQIPTEDVLWNAKEKRVYTILEALAELLSRTE